MVGLTSCVFGAFSWRGRMTQLVAGWEEGKGPHSMPRVGSAYLSGMEGECLFPEFVAFYASTVSQARCRSVCKPLHLTAAQLFSCRRQQR